MFRLLLFQPLDCLFAMCYLNERELYTFRKRSGAQATDLLRCWHVSNFVEFLYTLNGYFWTQAIPIILNVRGAGPIIGYLRYNHIHKVFFLEVAGKA